jgi:hypothetical protein
MPRRPGRLGAGLGVLAGLGSALAGACTTSSTGTGGCQINRQAEMPATPLTLLPDARLDTVGDGYMLSGVPDHTTVRWAAIDSAGAMGQEHQLAVAEAPGGPWRAFTSGQQPGDTLLVAQAIAKGADAELRVTTVPSGGAPTPPPAPGAALATVAGAAGGAPLVALAANRTGSSAVLTWVDPTAGVRALGLTPAGVAVGTAVDLGMAPVVACLGFVPGKKDLTVIYYRYPDATSRIPTLVINELTGGGAVDSTLELVLDSHDARCPQVIATPEGYALAFQDAQGGWLGVYRASNNRVSFFPFVEALAFGGGDLQPPLSGLMTAGTDYAVVFSRSHGGELWRIGPTGSRLGVLPFPTAGGHVGDVSTQLVSAGIVGSYADYTGFDAGVGAAGKRIFLGATCL